MPDLTVTLTDPQLARFLAGVGKALSLKDGEGQLRDATPAEAKQWVVDSMRSIVIRKEYLDQADAIVVSPFNPT